MIIVRVSFAAVTKVRDKLFLGTDVGLQNFKRRLWYL